MEVELRWVDSESVSEARRNLELKSTEFVIDCED